MYILKIWRGPAAPTCPFVSAPGYRPIEINNKIIQERLNKSNQHYTKRSIHQNKQKYYNLTNNNNAAHRNSRASNSE